MNDTQTDVQEGRLSEVGSEGFGCEGELEEGSRGFSEKTKARFWSKVNKTDGCWLWTGAKNKNGYGSFRVFGKTVLAHRVAWMMNHGDIESGLCVLHKCDTPDCVLPDHLFIGTHLDNMKDMISKGRDRKASGPTHPSTLHPERLPRGEAHWTFLHPERVARGDHVPLHRRARGETIGTSKLTAEKVIEIRRRYSNGGISLPQLGREFGVGFSNIWRIVQRQTWQHI